MRPSFVTIGLENDGRSGCEARDRITPVETHRSGTQNKTGNTQPEKTKTTEDSRKQPDPNQQHTRSFLPENRKEKNQRKQKKKKKNFPTPKSWKILNLCQQISQQGRHDVAVSEAI
jgi:hypothetical protein